MGARLSPGVKRRGALVRGVVQGVGFRPFVYNLALELGLTGRVANTGAGVKLAVQGPPGAVNEFMRRLEAEAPPLARIEAVEARDQAPAQGESGFVIAASAPGGPSTLISPDVAVCEACLAEMRDPADRRHGHAFINCTHCGPRYSITADVPYDRPNTGMAAFAMCPRCAAEYEDPADRRFHAQPTCCPGCGPRLWLAGPDGRETAAPDPIAAAAGLLRQGMVLAVKGLGGFHLAADALNPAAVQRLRERKKRWAKPLAVMVPDVAAAHGLAVLSPAEERLLADRRRPIVLLRAKPGGLAPQVHPGLAQVGLMLPYTPLHHLLMDQGFEALVMTSGNASDEPICKGNDEAVRRLGHICDAMLLHDRPIITRVDDSVARRAAGEDRLVRRGRGWAPGPINLPPPLARPHGPAVLACGAHLKNTLCLLRGNQAFPSQHIGDLEDVGTLEFFEETAAHLQRILGCRPEALAVDRHPDYLSTRWAAAQGLPIIAVQHHHAHAAAVMAEHGLAGPVLALCLDGVGLGDDGTAWGGELLLARLEGYERLGRLRPMALPGGDQAVRQPWRIGVALALEALGPQRAAETALGLRCADKLPLIAAMIEKGLNSPLSSGLGRLFDGAAALCGVCHEALYEGQAAMELEDACPPGLAAAPLPAVVQRAGGLWELDWRPMIRQLSAALAHGSEPGLVAVAFHSGIAGGLARLALEAAARVGIGEVCLGGGCLNNRILQEELSRALEAGGLRVYAPRALPAGDGGLSVGQAVVAAARLKAGLAPGGKP